MVSVSQSEYPFAGHFLDRDGVRQHYLDEGEGDPVVMLHGNPTWSFFYRNLVKELRDRFRVIVPDHVGCGLSDKPDESQYEYTLKQRVDDVESLLENLGITENITLVLHDWGGMIGMGFAGRRPERIKRIVLLNTGAFHLPKEKELPLPIWLVRDTPIGALLVRGLNAFSLGAVKWCATREPLSADVREGYLAPYGNWADRIGVLRFVQDIPLEPGDPSYDTVSEAETKLSTFADLPILILWGERDFVFDRHFLKEWREIWPKAELHSFPEAGHYLIEDERKTVLKLVGEFLDRHPITK
jgi:haloalkane dehalogenase